MRADRSNDDELIADWLATHEVTKCPAAFCAETPNVDLTPQDRAVHVARGIDPMGDNYRARIKHGWGAYWRTKKAGLGDERPAS